MQSVFFFNVPILKFFTIWTYCQRMNESVKGEPGVDYPILSAAPETSFECTDRSARNFIYNLWYLSFLYLVVFVIDVFSPDQMECTPTLKLNVRWVVKNTIRGIFWGADDRRGHVEHYQVPRRCIFRRGINALATAVGFFFVQMGRFSTRSQFVFLFFFVISIHFSLLGVIILHDVAKKGWGFFSNSYF